MIARFTGVRSLFGLSALFYIFLQLNGCDSKPRHGRNRAESELAAIVTAIENYHADHGEYPNGPDSDLLMPNVTFDPAAYIPSSALLYRALSGKNEYKKAYIELSPAALRTNLSGAVYIVDPQGNSYGYSTFALKHPASPDGNNKDYFDIWSTAGGSDANYTNQWIKNW